MTGTDLETATGETPMVAVRGVHKFFGDLHVLRGIDLDIAAGEVCVILGPSGSGKSTLLRCLNMLEGHQCGPRVRRWSPAGLPCGLQGCPARAAVTG